MALVNDIMNMQKCGGVIITQYNEHVEVDRVVGILSQEIHQYAQLIDTLGKTKIIPLETIKEALPLSLDYELPYARGNDEDYYDKDGEDDSFELLGNEEPFVNEEPNVSEEPRDIAELKEEEEPIVNEEPKEEDIKTEITIINEEHILNETVLEKNIKPIDENDVIYNI